ncbi:TWiK family of potassium channels protein 7-like [Diorhabda sublineata]|uniref:TWiK family of potassium channels protein 7-like n=1 Tax=Diorhabda sublineata TaxID=1163346 RepID=UPI0024E08B44|nr:TWiK family of potassium channels protein 7-like [Diorhabda sublineata]
MDDSNNSMSTTRRCIVAVLCGRISLFLVMTVYALFGAVLFRTIEGGDDHDAPVDFQKNREECLKELWLITERLNVLYEKNWTKLVTEQLRRFERAVVESKRLTDPLNVDSPHWNFGEALLYSVTILTTVGYGKLTPKTALGKLATIMYAVIGVPLMLVLLSAFGSLLASGARKSYSKLCCQTNDSLVKNPSVGYHKAPSSPSTKHYCKSHEDTASIQTTSIHNTPNHVNFRPNHHTQYIDQSDIPKRSLLATVRTNNTRGRSVRQTLADNTNSVCPAHAHHGVQIRNSSIIGIAVTSDLEEADDTDENDHVVCTHDTPSRIPLILRSQDNDTTASGLQPSPSVPALLVLAIFVAYVCAGAFAFSSTTSGSFIDAIYFCFIALSTIGIGDNLPQTSDFYTQIQLLACCVYIFVGLVVVAMCFSLVQEEVAFKCRQIANNLGIMKN